MTFRDFVGDANTGIIGQIIQPIVDLMFAGAVFFLLWNIFKIITNSDQPDKLAEFKEKAVWGFIAVAVMASVWGLIALVMGSTGLDTGAVLDIRTGP